MKTTQKAICQKLIALVITVALVFTVTLPASAAQSTITVNGQTCLSGYDLRHMRDSAGREATYGLTASGTRVSVNNIPSDAQHQWIWLMLMPYSETDISSTTYTDTVARSSAGSASFDLRSLYLVDDTSEYLQSRRAVPKGTYILCLLIGDQQHGTFMYEVFTLVEVDGSQRLGFHYPDYYQKDAEWREEIDQTLIGNYYMDFYRQAGASGDTLSQPEYNYVKNIADQISAKVPANANGRDYRLAYEAYCYLAQNLYYDFDNAADPDTPSDTDVVNILKTKKAVCAGFSVVYAALLSVWDIPCNLIYGFAPGQGGDEENFDPTTADLQDCNHAWNEAFVGGKWIMIDATWGCGNSFLDNTFEAGEMNDSFFDCGLENFSDMHCIVQPHTPELSYIMPNEDEAPENCYFLIANQPGVINGAEKTAAGLQLPETVTKVTPDGRSEVAVEWVLNDESCTYDPTQKSEQSFTAYGLVEDRSKQIACRVTVLAFGDIPAPAPLTKDDILAVTDSSVTIRTATGVEYSLDGTVWQSTGTFTGLKPGTDYSIVCRYAAVNGNPAGRVSAGYTVTTDRTTPAAPDAPTLQRASFNAITLTKMVGYEYKIEGGEWQSSNVFTGLQPETSYQFYQRVAESKTTYASASSVGASFTTTVKPPYTPGNIDNDEEENVDLKDVVILAQYVAEWNVICNEAALDVNGDSSVDLQDIVYLAQYVAGWEGIILY